MKKLFLRWILLAFSVFAASLVSQALNIGFKVDAGSPEGILKLLLGVAVLSLLNATLGKIIKFLTLPLSCITLGLFSLVVNAIILMVSASLNLGFTITQQGFMGFVAAFIASILISFINAVVGIFVPDDEKDD